MALVLPMTRWTNPQIERKNSAVPERGTGWFLCPVTMDIEADDCELLDIDYSDSQDGGLESLRQADDEASDGNLRSVHTLARPSNPHSGELDRGKNWCFTLHLPGGDEAAVKSSARDSMRSLGLSECVAYLVYGLEKAPTTQRLHVQGFLQLYKRERLSYVRSLVPGAHWELARGTPAQNRAYCIKDGDYGQYGALRNPDPGNRELQREQWSDALQLAKAGAFPQLEDAYPRIAFLHHHTVRAIHKDYQVTPPDALDVRGVWIWGAAGVGKSRTARERYKPFYAKMANKWWDGYQDEPYVILDDVGPEQAKFLSYHLKIWSDRYAFVAEIKGGSRKISPGVFCVTSQYSIEELWHDDSATREALLRRFKVERMGPESSGIHPYFRSV